LKSCPCFRKAQSAEQPASQNSKLKTQNSKLKTQNSKLKTRTLSLSLRTPLRNGFKPFPTQLHGTLSQLRKTSFLVRWDRRSGNEALERTPLNVQLPGYKPINRFHTKQGLINHDSKRPHSNAEESGRLAHPSVPFLVITTQSSRISRFSILQPHWILLNYFRNGDKTSDSYDPTVSPD